MKFYTTAIIIVSLIVVVIIAKLVKGKLNNASSASATSGNNNNNAPAPPGLAPETFCPRMPDGPPGRFPEITQCNKKMFAEFKAKYPNEAQAAEHGYNVEWHKYFEAHIL